MNKKIFRCHIKTLSPVHMGCDEVYEPTGFVMNKSEQKIIVFDPLDFISKLEDDDRQKFSEICLKGTISSILEIYKFLANRPASGRTVAVCSGFLDHYEKTIAIPINNERKVKNELNQFQIPRTAYRSGDQRPYIPGSAIKGALRTAYLNGQVGSTRVELPKSKNAAQVLEKKLLDYTGISDDPFRLVKVSDFQPVGDISTKIIYAVNEKKRISDRKEAGLPLLFEVIEPGAMFRGTISVETPLDGAEIKRPIALDTLLNCCLEFYGKEKKREEAELNSIGASTGELYDLVDKTALPMLMRVGRHSGAESITIDGYRNIKVMVGRGKWKAMDRATTFWLVSDVRRPNVVKSLRPFGWVQVVESIDEIAAGFQQTESEWVDQYKTEHEIRQNELQRTARLLEAAKEAEIRLKQEEDRKREEEAKRKAELEAMSPEDKLVAEIKSPDVTENRIVEIFNQLDQFSSEHQKKLAGALKDYWIVNAKWKKKSCTKKQWVKVQKIKTILDDE